MPRSVCFPSAIAWCLNVRVNKSQDFGFRERNRNICSLLTFGCLKSTCSNESHRGGTQREFVLLWPTVIVLVMVQNRNIEAGLSER